MTMPVQGRASWYHNHTQHDNIPWGIAHFELNSVLQPGSCDMLWLQTLLQQPTDLQVQAYCCHPEYDTG